MDFKNKTDMNADKFTLKQPKKIKLWKHKNKK